MAGPRQRRKARSSVAKATRKPKSRKLNLQGLPIELSSQYDRRRTVSQNMARIGLAQKPLGRKQVGGTERKAVEVTTSTQEKVPEGYARVKRDSSGKIIEIEENESSEATQTPWGVPLNAEDADEAVSNGRQGAKTGAIKVLEHKASLMPDSKPRHASSAEMLLLQQLVAAHGRDVEAMSRDKRNRLQRTAGQLRQSIKRSGGWALFEQPNA